MYIIIYATSPQTICAILYRKKSTQQIYKLFIRQKKCLKESFQLILGLAKKLEILG